MQKKIAIVGTVGIPANYGGFETLVEYLTKKLSNQVSITVYCSSKNYIKKLSKHNGAFLHYIPLNANGIQSIPYDIISLFNAARKNETILVLGVSGCIILPLFRLFYPKKKLIINIDGLEYKREKWSKPIRQFLKYSEKLAIKYSDDIIADNKAIQDYISDKYNQKSNMIPYGGDHSKSFPLSKEIKDLYSLPSEYAFKVCRIEPENNVHLILEAFSTTTYPLVIIGNWANSEYGKNLKLTFEKFKNIFLFDPTYDQLILNQLRSNYNIYIHGHSAGGTNPSLVEAMHHGLPIFAFDVVYNRETTFNQALYFKNSDELKNLINKRNNFNLNELGSNMKKIALREYTWEKITKQYFELF